MTPIFCLHFFRGCPGCVIPPEVHTSDRSPHLIVCGRLLLKNEMVKCAGNIRSSVQSAGKPFSQVELGMSNQSTWRVQWSSVAMGQNPGRTPQIDGKTIGPHDSSWFLPLPSWMDAKFQHKVTGGQVHSEQSRLSGVRIPAPWLSSKVTLRGIKSLGCQRFSGWFLWRNKLHKYINKYNIHKCVYWFRERLFGERQILINLIES